MMTQKNIIPDIQFLRILSVIGVVLFHYFPNVFSNGYLGVDIFFVVSGFVITKSLRDEFNWGSILTFYKRRILRIIPILYVVLFTTLVLSFFLDTPHATKNIGQGILATTVYLANVFYYTEIDYFNTFQNNSPLTHTWSLSLEEQFYLLFPFLFLLFKGKVKRIIFLFLIALISLLIYFSCNDHLFRFYMPHTRFWQLLLGVLLALNFKKEIMKNDIVHYFALISIVILLFFIGNPMGSVVILIPLIIVLVVRPINSIYEYKFIYVAGALSYSIYLWHQPFFYYSELFYQKSLVNFFLNLFLISIVAYFSFVHIENRFRYSTRNSTMLLLLFFSLLLILLGYFSHTSRGLFDLKRSIYTLEKSTVEFDTEVLMSDRNNLKDSIMSLPINDSSIVIVGDSKSEDLVCALYLVTGRRYPRIKQYSLQYSVDFFHDKENVLLLAKAKKVIFTNTWERSNIDGVRNVMLGLGAFSEADVFIISTSNFDDVSSQYFTYYRKGFTRTKMFTEFKKSVRWDWQRKSNELKTNLLRSSSFRFTWVAKEDCFLNSSDGFISDNKLNIYDSGHLTRHGFVFFGKWIAPILGVK